ncbi:Cytochrome c553 [Pseudomonas panipatensis]|uniref:Cytochrome c553 n=2 Tax=Pseudomonas panipatensis TaxID=428992 RepID=A0A1G8KRX8_9PSED|nr:Cytochrome c553 [Pseudomonas panipatensis]SMP70488.1 Cytochrome c553 [Pseudomonas panipatensis]
MMKRALVISALTAATALVAAGAIYGPEMYAGYRFMSALDEHDAQYQANGGAWPQLQDTCALCHGAHGQPRDAQYASLAGQSAAYIEAQLHAFADGHRHSPQMSPLAANLNGEQIKLLAGYFSQQKAEWTEPGASNKPLEQRGQDLVATKACTACHGKGLSGGPIAPRIAGQGEFYLIDQLTAFKRGDRKDPSQAMNAMASSLSDDDIQAIAHYLGTLAPTTE